MNITQLMYFRHLAQRQHLLKTAEELHVSPSAVSASLKSLEQELGTPLFDRGGRHLTINDQGQALLPYVDQAFEALEQGKKAVLASLSQRKNELAFSFKYTAFYNDLIPLVLKECPGLRIRHYDVDADYQGKLIWEEDLDLMITARDFSDHPKLDYKTISCDCFCLVVNPDHWLAQREMCSLWELRDEVFLHRPKDNYYQTCVDVLLEEFSFHPGSVIEAGYMVRPTLLRSFPGVAVTTMGTMATDFFSGLHMVRVKEFENRTYELRAYWRKDRPLPPACAVLIRVAESLAPGHGGDREAGSK